MSGSYLEEELLQMMLLSGLPKPEREYRFHPTRRWKFDFAYPALKLAIEAEGGIWSRGAHTRGRGYGEDCEKYNAAVLLGWRVLRFTGEMIQSGEAVNAIEEAMK